MARAPSRYQHLTEIPMNASKWESAIPYDCKPGYCVIINNMKFNSRNLKDLDGGKDDEDGLNVLFTTLGFEVIVHQNITAKEMRSTVEEYSRMDHKGRAFILILLSHGGEGDVVYGTDGGEVEVERLEQLFYTTSCPSLAGVPKVFLIDACRGKNHEKMHQYHDVKSNINGLKRCHSETGSTDSSDFIIVYASTRGNVAYMLPGRSNMKGSCFTQTLLKVTTEANENTEFRAIVTEVTSQVQKIKAQTVSLQSTSTKPYYIKRNTEMFELQELQRKFTEAVQLWLPVRTITIQEIKDTAKKLQEHHRNVNISRITGSSVSIGGSVMAIVGFGLAPVTFGASIALSAAGIGIAVAGGATVAGASVADIFIEKSNLKDVQNRLDRDFKQVKAIQGIAERIEQIIQKIREKCPNVSATTFIAVFAQVFAQGLVQTGRVGIKIAEFIVLGSLEIGAAALRVGGAAAKGIAGAAIAINIVLIPIDIIEIVRSGISLIKGSQTKAIEKLNALASELEDQKKSLQAQANITD